MWRRRLRAWPNGRACWLALATGAGAALMRLTGRANPWFIGPLLAAMGLTMADVHLSSVPTALTNAAQLVIGVSLGVRFTRRFCMPRRAGWRPPHWARWP